MGKNVLIFNIIIISCLLFSFVSAATPVTSVSVAVCGNGVLENGEQCDAGQIRYSGETSYPSVSCSPSSCTCPDGASPVEKHFVSDLGKCVTITDCSKSCEVGGADYMYDVLHPHCGCPYEAACKCKNPDDTALWSSCNTCNSPDPLARSTCYCGDSQNGLNEDAFPWCSSIGYACNWTDYVYAGTGIIIGGGTLKPDCVPATYSIPATVPTTTISTPSLDLGLSIKVGDGNSVNRNVVCAVNVVPKEKGLYAIAIYLDSPSGSTYGASFSQNVVGDGSPCDLLTPNPIIESYTFLNALNAGSPAYTCRVDYSTPSESNFTSSNPLQDLDKDGSVSKNQFNQTELALKPWSRYDVDDWVFNDTLYGDSTTDYKCISDGSADYYMTIIPEIANKIKNCTVDNNNDGIGDYAACSYCRNPRAMEVADDIDNEGMGVCQANVSRTCRVEGYVGDGADNPGTPVNIVDSSGAVVGKMGCGDVVNDFGVVDTFCQMVDNVAGMGNYQRAVKWGERVLNDHIVDASTPTDFPLNYNVTQYLDFIPGSVVGDDDFSFIPGRVDIRDTHCSIKEIVYPIETRSLVGMSTFNALISKLSGYATGYFLDKRIYAGFGLNYVSVLVKYIDYPGCMPQNESDGKSRNTIGAIFPTQFIDSFRGELNFTKFYNYPGVSNLLKIKGDDGKFLFTWKTAFVEKDKCNDGVNNHGTNDLLVTEPYGRFMAAIKKAIVQDGTATIPYDLHPDFNVSLADVDNADCKWNNPSPIGVDHLPRNYSTWSYKINNRTGDQYCLDNDHDGFCGVKTVVVPLADCVSINRVIVSHPASGVVGCAFLNYTDYMFYRAFPDPSDKAYSTSKQFPDCEDNSVLNPSGYKIGGHDLLVSPLLGWPTNFAGQLFTSWNIHPFAPVNPYTCTLGSKGSDGSFGYDFNCNKNGVEGKNLESLKSGGTPFDWDLGTGAENLAYGADSPWYKQILISDNRDAECYEYPSYRGFAVETATNVAFSLAGIGIAGLGAGVWGSMSLGGFAVRSAIGLTFSSPMLWQTCIVERNIPYCIAQGAFTIVAAGLAGAESPGGLIGKFNKQTGERILATAERDLKPVPRSEIEFPSAANPLDGKEPPEAVPAEPGATPGCFLNGTNIYLANGSLKNIAEVKLNDSILAWDLQNNRSVNASVTYTFVRNDTQYRLVQYEEI